MYEIQEIKDERLKTLEDLVRVLQQQNAVLQQQIVVLQNRVKVIEGSKIRYPSFTPIGDPCIYIPEDNNPWSH